MTWKPVPGAHVYGVRFSLCKECASSAEHDYRDLMIELESTQARIKELEARVEELTRLGNALAHEHSYANISAWVRNREAWEHKAKAVKP